MPGMVTSVLEMIATTIEERKINLYLNWIQVFFFPFKYKISTSQLLAQNALAKVENLTETSWIHLISSWLKEKNHRASISEVATTTLLTVHNVGGSFLRSHRDTISRQTSVLGIWHRLIYAVSVSSLASAFEYLLENLSVWSKQPK